MDEMEHQIVMQMIGQDFVNDFLYYSDFADPNNSIEHYGILGMRWGVIRTPRQLGHEPEGGKDYKAKEGKDPNSKEKRERKSIGDRIKDAKKKNQQKKNLEKARAAKAKKKEEAKEREEMLKDPKKLYENRDKFTKKEIDDAVARFRSEAALKQYSDAEREAGRQKVQAVMNAIKKGGELSGDLIKLYNNMAYFKNTFFAGEDGDKEWPIINTKAKGDKKKSDDDDDDNDSNSGNNSNNKPSNNSNTNIDSEPSSTESQSSNSQSKENKPKKNKNKPKKNKNK